LLGNLYGFPKQAFDQKSINFIQSYSSFLGRTRTFEGYYKISSLSSFLVQT
jgi:hypothetical protein